MCYTRNHKARFGWVGYSDQILHSLRVLITDQNSISYLKHTASKDRWRPVRSGPRPILVLSCKGIGPRAAGAGLSLKEGEMG
jgi:hypothetical protein